MWGILITLAILIFLMITKLKFSIEYKRDKENDLLKITVVYLKYLKKSFTVPLIDIASYDGQFGLKYLFGKRKKVHHGTEYIDFDSIINLIKKVKEYYRVYKHTFDEVIEQLKKKIKFDYIMIRAAIGLYDPAATAIATGFAYSIISNILSYISSKIMVKSCETNVTPNFKDEEFEINLFCIFKVRIGNIIYVSLRAIFVFLYYKFFNTKEPLFKININ